MRMKEERRNERGLCFFINMYSAYIYLMANLRTAFKVCFNEKYKIKMKSKGRYHC